MKWAEFGEQTYFGKAEFYLLNTVFLQSEEQLIELQEMYLNLVKIGVTENIPTTLLTVSNEDEALEDALKGKYDAILTSLVAKSLLQKV